MRIKSLRVQNYRSILDAEISFDDLTILIGSNGAGKSSFLAALNLFHTKASKITEDDFYYKDTSKDIVFELVFINFNKIARKKFEKYIFDDELKLEYRIKCNDGKFTDSLHGYKLINTDFEKLRGNIKVDEKKQLYDDLQNKLKYDLPKCKTGKEIDGSLLNWEKKNKDKCKILTSNDDFFGFKNVGGSYLEDHIKITYIPAVKDASIDAEEGKGSILSNLTHILINKTIENDKDFAEYKSSIKKQWKNKFQKKHNEKLLQLSSRLTNTLQQYINDSNIKLLSNQFDIALDLPTVKAKLTEDCYQSTVERTGHGLQRLFIIAMLEEISKTPDEKNTTNKPIDSFLFPTMIMIIEEPELYQHPVRQRNLFRKFSEISKNTDLDVQIIFTTHSPYFIDMDIINNVRLITKIKNNDTYMITKVSKTTKIYLADKLSKLHPSSHKRITENNIALRLYSMRTPLINEGFFSKCVVLVEGDGDKNAIIEAATKLGKRLDDMNVSVIACNSKENLDKPNLVFESLGIKTFTIWDKDKNKINKNKSCNKNKFDNKIKVDNNEKMHEKLFKLCNKNNTSTLIFHNDYSYVYTNFAYFINDLEDILYNEIPNNKYKIEGDKQRTNYGITSNKQPELPRLVLEKFEKYEIPKTLVNIVNSIECLVNT